MVPGVGCWWRKNGFRHLADIEQQQKESDRDATTCPPPTAQLSFRTERHGQVHGSRNNKRDTYTESKHDLQFVASDEPSDYSPVQILQVVVPQPTSGVEFMSQPCGLSVVVHGPVPRMEHVARVVCLFRKGALGVRSLSLVHLLDGICPQDISRQVACATLYSC